jgi:hypothetical protein
VKRVQSRHVLVLAAAIALVASAVFLLLAEPLPERIELSRPAVTPRPDPRQPRTRAEDLEERPDQDSFSGLPPAYRGEVRISGKVRDSGGGPVPQARVQCYPVGFHPSTEQQHLWLSRSSDRDGLFTFDSLPRTASYRFVAHTNSDCGEVTVGAGQATSTIVEVVVGRLFYERFEFFDDHGEPVDVSATHFGLVRGFLLTSSHAPWGVSSDVVRLLEGMGLSLRTKRNELINIHRNNDFVVTGPDLTLNYGKTVVTLPGYRPTAVESYRSPLSEWPAARRITLRRNRTTARDVARFRVQLPKLAWPAAWGPIDEDQQLVLYATTGDVPAVTPITSRIDTFLAQRSVQPTLYQQGFEPLQYVREVTAQAILIKPKYPKYGFLEVHYCPAVDRDRIYGVVATPQHPGSGHVEIPGTMMWPGHVRFGPIPAGTYLLKEYLLFSGSPSLDRRQTQNLGAVDVVGGFRVHHCD